MKTFMLSLSWSQYSFFLCSLWFILEADTYFPIPNLSHPLTCLISKMSSHKWIQMLATNQEMANWVDLEINSD